MGRPGSSAGGTNIVDKKILISYNNTMLEQNDLQAIGTLLDQKLDEKLDKKFKENNKLLKDEIVAEIGAVTSEAFSAVEAKIDKLETKVDQL